MRQQLELYFRDFTNFNQQALTTTTTATTTMTFRICKKCGHKQELEHIRRTKWACSDCGHRNKLRKSPARLAITAASIFGLAIALLVIPLGIAYGATETINVPFPQPYEETCSYSIGEYLIFNCIWRSEVIPDEVQDQIKNLENKTDILPPDEIEAGINRILMKWITAPDPETIPEPEPPRPTVRDILIEKLDPGVKELVEKLYDCQYGYDGWEAIQQQSVYEIPKQFIRSVDDYTTDKLVGDLNKAYEACRIQRDYPLSSSYKEFIDADLLGLTRFGQEITHTFNQTTNFTRGSDIYKPLDAMDLFKANEKASDWLRDEAPFIDPTLGCIPRDDDDNRCVNQGNPEPIIKDLRTYNEYINFKAGQIQTAQDYADTIKAAQEAQCKVHYPIYKHKIASDGLPVWLEHCETLEDEELRIGFACYTGGEQILCSELRKIKEAREN